MRKTAYILTALLILSLVGCGAVKSADSYFPDEHFESSVLPEECFICSPSIPNWGQNNVGIISLNTFEVLPIEINRYRNGWILIEENTGTFSMRPFNSGDGGFQASLMTDPDRGHASASVFFYEDEKLDVEKMAGFLCEDCLNEVTGKIYKNEYGLGIINFETGEIDAFEENNIGFGSGDYYIHCDFKGWDKREKSNRLDLVIFYCPLRYDNEA